MAGYFVADAVAVGESAEAAFGVDGADMSSTYKETSQVGLAVNVAEC